jgi:Protein of unknown function (DUF3823) N-terminal domain/Domain of unknown function (DUF3823_C)
MRIPFKYFSILVFAAAVFSCKKDNYDPPSLTLNGALLYQGDTIYVEKNAVHFQIYQYGFGRVGPVSTDETFAQNGVYSAALFDGDYKLIVPNGDGPFMWKQTIAGVPDSVDINMKGNQSVDLEVTPYYMIPTTQIVAAGTDSVHATFSVNKVITDANAKDIEYVALYVNKTQFVSGSNNINAVPVSIAGTDITDMNNIQLGAKFNVPVPAQSYVFARIGLKIANVEDLIFSPMVKVTF